MSLLLVKLCTNILKNTLKPANSVNPRWIHASTCLASLKKPEQGKPADEALWKKPYVIVKNVTSRWIGKYESWWARKHPKSFRIYLLFKVGMQDLFRDCRSCSNVAWQIRRHKVALDRFSLYELDNYRQIPRDVIRCSPVVVIAALPFMNYVILPVAYFFPRQLLSRHFWTPEQRIEFGTFRLQKRIHTYPKIFSFMMKECDRIKDVGQRKVFQDVLLQIERGEEAELEAILDCKDVFTGKPLGLDRLYLTHRLHVQWHIAHSFGFPGRKSKLVAATNLMWHVDRAMLREGIDSLNLEQQRLACMVRGLNVVDLPQEELVKYLRRWTTISNAVTPESFSLLLHSPVLLSYSHPSNQKYLIEAVDITKGVIRP